MPYEICDKLKNLTPYEPISGSYPVRLDANESFVPLSGELRLKVMEAVAGTSFHRYPDALASDVCGAFAARFGVSKDCVTAGNGSDELISVIVGSVLQKGDSLLTFAPDFSMYRFYGELTEADVITLGKEDDLTLNAAKMIRSVWDTGARAVIFSNPCNPTSLVLPAEDVLRLADSTNALVVVDEAYMDFSNQSVLQKAQELDNVIVLKTCSKAMGAAAIRLGFAVSNPRITSALRAAKSPYNTDSLSQLVGTLLLREEDYLSHNVRELVRSRDILYAGLTRLAEFKTNSILRVFKPETNFVFVQMKDAGTCFEGLLGEGIVVRKFGEYLRITAGSDEENTALLSALARIL